MRILVWSVHGGWLDGFTRGGHEYLVPASTAPHAIPRVTRVPDERLREQPVDVVVMQRVEELAEAERLLRLVPGREVPAVFVEHNTPKAAAVSERHFLADQQDIAVVHVTHFNDLVWDTGSAPVRVIEHGVADPGALYTGERPACGVVVNEAVRRGRITGTDLLPRFARQAPLDVFGIAGDLLPQALGLGSDRIRFCGDLPSERLHAELATRRMYLHPFRWTSLGLALIEAMMLGMPVLALATTEAPRAVPPEAGALSTDVDELIAAARLFLDDPERARRSGREARAAALERYRVDRFLDDWDQLLADSVERHSARHRRPVAAGSAPLPSRPLGSRTKGTDR